MIVLLINPFPGSDRRRADNPHECVVELAGRKIQLDLCFSLLKWTLNWAAIEWRVIREWKTRNTRDHLSIAFDDQVTVVGDLADYDRVQFPFLEDVENLSFAAGVRHQQHSLLRLREHDLVRRHTGLALRHQIKIDLDSVAGARRHLTR